MHDVVPSHGWTVPSLRQLNPLQHGFVGEQDWPAFEQVELWQVPLVEPEGTTQPRPVQQSAPVVQTPSFGWHTFGTAHVPLLHTVEQHSEPLVQATPFDLQTPASLPVGGSRQLEPTSPARHSPEQQVVDPAVQDSPSGVQELAVQRSTPTLSGTQGAPLQHWSLNWQSSPTAMQHGTSPV